MIKIKLLLSKQKLNNCYANPSYDILIYFNNQ